MARLISFLVYAAGIFYLGLVVSFHATVWLSSNGEQSMDSRKSARRTSTFESSDDARSTQSPPTCGAAELFASVPVRGLHLVCVDESPTRDGFVRVTIFPQSRNESVGNEPTSWSFEHARANVALDRAYDDEAAYKSLRLVLEQSEAIGSGLRSQQSANAWAFFTPTGEAIGTRVGSAPDTVKGSLEALLWTPTALLFEGGIFMWPGVRVGYRQDVHLLGSSSSFHRSDARTVTLETLSMEPLVLAIDNFLDMKECDYIRQNSESHVRQSGVSLMDKDRGRASTDWRTSATYFMPSKPHPPLQTIDKRVASLSRVPVSHQELVQVLRYAHGEKYDAHHDYFDPRLYSKDARTLRLIQHGRANRMATVLWYLSDVQGGGETVFPRSGNLPAPRNNSPEGGICERGMKVSPKKGKAIIFYSLLPSGQPDALSLHGACPVVGGDHKWAANKWVWSTPMSHLMQTP